MESIRLRQHGQWLPADVQTPISLYLSLVGDRPGILLESAEVDGRLGRFSLMAWDFRLRLAPRDGRLALEIGDPRLEGLRDLEGLPYLEGVRRAMSRLVLLSDESVGELPALTRGLYGYFGYNTAGMFEPALAGSVPPVEAEACLVLAGRVVLFDHLRHRCCFLSLDEGARPEALPVSLENGLGGCPDEPEAAPGREEYCAAVRRAKELITEGEGIQIVLSTRFSVPAREDGFSIYRRLRQANPSPFMFFMRFPEVVLLGSSPEMMVRCEKGRLEVRPIAGTRPRSADPARDDALAEEMLADPKERAEHVMLVDLGRNDLGRIAAPGTVRVERFMQVERFSHVMHLTSYVEARLRDGLDALDVLASTFPAGTVSGAPKIWAMRTIAAMERRNRGPYAGCIGWLGLDKDAVSLDTGITIRSLWIRDGKVCWQAGAGLVYDSVPEKEWEECNNKARVLREVIRGKEGGDVFAHR
ncbi:MAG: anthranilate synthase component I family protein [Desulfovibrio aminophilus]|jgi:anthranilate synthase, component I (EC 4.1.3.27)|uniref:anthranilate synthase component I family protein n=1 Tax=Desulfovibrio aminophilus TaxID=81425 RepID=UPI0039E88D89